MRHFAKLIVCGLTAPALALLAAPTVLAQETSTTPQVRDDSQEGAIPIEPNRTDLRELTGPPRLPETETSTARPSLPSVLAILAHPDDEITIAPVLSRIARAGGEVTVVFATSGDAGPGVSGLEMGAELAALRESEAQCAAFALVLPEPIFWRFGDGTLSDSTLSDRTLSDTGRAPDSAALDLAGDLAGDMTGRIEALIALRQPDIVMTWGPDGGYGHADHIMVSDTVTQVVQAMGAGRPRLLYSAIPAGELTALPGFENWTMTDPSLITDRIRYEEPDLEATRIAIDCYQSQFPQAERDFLPDALHQGLWRGTVYFRQAFALPE